MSGPSVARPDARGAIRQYRRDSYFDSRGRETHEALTSREVEILSYVAGGNTNRQIASALQISEQTIKNHISHILRRSKANDRAHAVFLAIRQGLISVGAESAG
jgi:DNA-binding NarL/FixJ family response regulator